MAWIVTVLRSDSACCSPRGARGRADLPRRSRSTSWCLMLRAASPTSPRASSAPGSTEAWGQQVVVENKPGGNGFIAMTAGAKAAPDGYTLTMATVGDVAINPAMFKEMPYNVQRDFAPIAMVSDAPMVLAVHGAARYKTVADVIAAAKARPGQLSVGAAGERQRQPDRPGVDGAQHRHQVPAHPLQRRGAGCRPALAGGDIPFGVLASSSVAPHVKSGRVRPLAVTMAKRSQFRSRTGRPCSRQGVKEVDASNWTALFAPKGTPQPIIDKLNAEVVRSLLCPTSRNASPPAVSKRFRRARRTWTRG